MSDKRASIDRVSEIAQQWFLNEPLLFSAWTTHRVVLQSSIATIRVGRGLVEVNPEFVGTLDRRALREVMKLEAVRILLKHPYDRRRQNSTLSYEASNLAIQECVPSSLPLTNAAARFGTDEHNGKYLEYYYQLLCKEQSLQIIGASGENPSTGFTASEVSNGCVEREDGSAKGNVSEKTSSPGAVATRDSNRNAGPRIEASGEFRSESPARRSDLATYCALEKVAFENAGYWGQDAFFCEQINRVIEDVEASQCWGTIAGTVRELILATRIPKLDYRRVLRAFRASVLSSHRRLSRMKPSRRYGFDYMGSRRDFCTKLLFAVDVSGSLDSADVRSAFSIVNRLFKYGIEKIDVIWFDTKIRNDQPLELKRAARAFRVEGRGGTNFQPIMSYLDTHRDYDGLMVFTDGIAPTPQPPRYNRRTRVVWLFNHERNWRQHYRSFERQQMLSAFVQHD